MTMTMPLSGTICRP